MTGTSQEFIIRTRRGNIADVFVSRRYGDFKTLANEVHIVQLLGGRLLIHLFVDFSCAKLTHRKMSHHLRLKTGRMLVLHPQPPRPRRALEQANPHHAGPTIIYQVLSPVVMQALTRTKVALDQRHPPSVYLARRMGPCTQGSWRARRTD